MKLAEYEITNSIYYGVSIFSVLKDLILTIDDKIISFEDKKDLSLYLGIINSENEISNKYKDVFLKLAIDYELLDQDSYNLLYDQYFMQKLNSIKFNSMNDYFNFLLNTDIVKRLNKDGCIFKKQSSNKILVKK